MLYEVIAEETSEEGVAKRRGGDRTQQPTQLRVVSGEPTEGQVVSSPKAKPAAKPGKAPYPYARPRVPKAAEPLGDW